MQGVIGATLINQIKPASRPLEIRDTRLKGFLLRVQPSGVMSFYVEYGRGKRYRIGRADAMKPEAARRRAKDILGDVYHGADPMEAKRKAKAHTLATFVDQVYKPWAEANILSAGETVRVLKSSFPDMQDKKLHDLTPWLVEKWRSARLRSGTRPATVNRALGNLKSAVAKAVAWELLETHPLAAVKPSRVDTAATVRFLSHSERKALLKALDEREERIRSERDSANDWRKSRGYSLLPSLRSVPFADHLKPLVLLSLNTGMRRGELFGLRWEDVHLEHSNLTVRGETAKSRRTRHIPLNATAHDVLTRWREQAGADNLVFPARDGGRLNNVRKSWRLVLELAKIQNFRWHDMRHSFASALVMKGVDLNTVRELLGHSTITMTLRYSHLAPEHKAAAVARLVDVAS